MTSAAFRKVLEATGYLAPNGLPASGLMPADDPRATTMPAVFSDERVGLRANAVFTAQNAPTSIFKDSGDKEPSAEDLSRWHEAAWNVGVAPLLWIITPTDVRIYDCYATPDVASSHDVHARALDSFSLESEGRLNALDIQCGRLATETGAFWSSPIGSRIDRRHRVDRELLAEISALEDRLTALGDPATSQELKHYRDIAQRFIGRCIFTWYLLDRGIAQPFLPPDMPAELTEMFSTQSNAFALFDWLRATFNGDLFPMDDPGAERELLTGEHLDLIRDFIEGRSLLPDRFGQGRLFRFKFNAIPVDLISSIYQQFARTSAADEARSQGLHYTPVELVHLTLDPVFEGLQSDASVIDPACGSGAFLVEAFRRLVWRGAAGKPAGRELVRRILYEQLFGLDINRSALGIAAFSLYLAALELDQEPISDIGDLKFDRLIGTTLFEVDSVGDVLPVCITERSFDAVVGNPPWTYAGKGETKARSRRSSNTPLRPRRSPDQEFLALGAKLAGERGRLGMVMKATPFFSKDVHAIASRNMLLQKLAPVSLVNLSNLRRENLFPDAVGPAVLFFSRCALGADTDRLLVGSIPWTPDFRRTGVFGLGPGDIRSVPLKRVLSTPPFLKAATFGTVRDGWLIERLEKELQRFDVLLEILERNPVTDRGQGFQVFGEKHIPPARYSKLKVVTPDRFTPFRLDQGALDDFTHPTLHRPRRESIFRGPILLCPKVGNATAESRRPYGAAVVPEDTLYTQNFYGVSFADSDVRYAYALSAILNSSLTAFQLAFGGPTWGLERPTVEPHDLMSLRVPDLTALDPEIMSRLLSTEEQAAAEPWNIACIDALDEAVFDAYELDDDERVVARDGVERARHLVSDNRGIRAGAIVPPTADSLKAYAGQVTSSVDRYLRARGERHLKAYVYTEGPEWGHPGSGVPGVTIVRFTMAKGGPKDQPVVLNGNNSDLEYLRALLRGTFAGPIPPYLNERRQIRIYGVADLLIMKPSEARNWTRTTALNDADIVLSDHWLHRGDTVVRT